MVTASHEEYCGLLDTDNQQPEGNWFDDLDHDVFNFKHNVHSWLKKAAQKTANGSMCSSSKKSSTSRSSASNKSSSSSRSSTKLKLLEEKAKTAELKAEAALLMEPRSLNCREK